MEMITSKFIILILFAVFSVDLILANQRISEIKCKEYESITQIPFYVRSHPSFPASTVLEDKCLRNGAPLIKGGEEALIHEFPHQALLGYMKQKVHWSCGGSLVSPNFILTAAHCLDSKETGPVRFVKLGMLRRSQTNNTLVRVYSISEKHKHENYDRKTNLNDIALLKLRETVKFNEQIYPICLPTKQYESNAIATGFGKTGGVDAPSEHLLKVALQHFNFTVCGGIFNVKNERVFRNNMICYGHRKDNKDACKGDSGGPLQVYSDDIAKCTYTQIGVVSFGVTECGTSGVPGVYTNVYHYLDWIENIVWKDEIESK